MRGSTWAAKRCCGGPVVGRRSACQSELFDDEVFDVELFAVELVSAFLGLSVEDEVDDDSVTDDELLPESEPADFADPPRLSFL